MSSMGSRITSLAVAGMLCVGVSRMGMAQSVDTVDAVKIETTTVTMYRTTQPAHAPAAKAEVKGVAPSKNALWVPGYWDLQGNRSTGSRAGWDWIPGEWLTPPARNAHWFPAHWGFSKGWWSWIPGHWTQGDNWIPSSN